MTLQQNLIAPPKAQPVAAGVIYQAALDTVSRALMRSDFDEILKHLGFPNVMEVQEGIVTIATAQEMRACLEEQVVSIRRLRVTDYHRICLAAEYTNEDATEILGLHETHVISGGTYAMPIIRSEMRMRRSPTGWQSVALKSNLRNRDLTVLCPRQARLQKETV